MSPLRPNAVTIDGDSLRQSMTEAGQGKAPARKKLLPVAGSNQKEPDVGVWRWRTIREGING